MSIGTKLFTKFKGEEVGRDPFSNIYYTEKKVPEHRRARRWVMYAGEVDPTTVPPEWFGWLHYTTDTPPTEQPPVRHHWQKPSQPNLSGTTEAYLPSGHLLRGNRRANATSDYIPWTPKP